MDVSTTRGSNRSSRVDAAEPLVHQSEVHACSLGGSPDSFADQGLTRHTQEMGQLNAYCVHFTSFQEEADYNGMGSMYTGRGGKDFELWTSVSALTAEVDRPTNRLFVH